VSERPALRTAIINAALVEAVLLAAGVVLFLTTGNFFWLIGAVIGGALTFVFFLFQAGAFDRGDE
jgi:hypothetical protein